MTFTPSPQQAAAIAVIVRWYRDNRWQQQVARIWGYAGTGKSTITRYVIEELGLTPMNRGGGAVGGVLFAAFTGKAARRDRSGREGFVQPATRAGPHAAC